MVQDCGLEKLVVQQEMGRPDCIAPTNFICSCFIHYSFYLRRNWHIVLNLDVSSAQSFFSDVCHFPQVKLQNFHWCNIFFIVEFVLALIFQYISNNIRVKIKSTLNYIIVLNTLHFFFQYFSCRSFQSNQLFALPRLLNQLRILLFVIADLRNLVLTFN